MKLTIDNTNRFSDVALEL